MKKIILLLGVIAVIFMMFSNVTAVQQNHSSNIFNILERKESYNIKLNIIKDGNSFIDKIIKLLEFLMFILEKVLSVLEPFTIPLIFLEFFILMLLEKLNSIGDAITEFFELITRIKNLRDDTD